MKPKRCSVPSTEVSTLVGRYVKDRVLPTCHSRNRWVCRFDGGNREHMMYGLIRKRNVASWATTDGCVEHLLALFIPHGERKVNESIYPDCATLRFGKSWRHGRLRATLIYLPEWRDYLEFPRVSSLFPACGQGGIIHLRPFRGDGICVKKVEGLA